MVIDIVRFKLINVLFYINNLAHSYLMNRLDKN